MNEMRQRLDSMHATTTGIRWGVIGFIAMGWPVVVRVVQRRQRFSGEEIALLKSLRWRIAIWLVVIELLLGQNLIGQFIALAHGNQA